MKTSGFKEFKGISGNREVLGKGSGKFRAFRLVYFIRVFTSLNYPKILKSLKILKMLRGSPLKPLKILEVVAP